MSTESGFLSWIIRDLGNLTSHLLWSSVKGLCPERCVEQSSSHMTTLICEKRLPEKLCGEMSKTCVRLSWKEN